MKKQKCMWCEDGKCNKKDAKVEANGNLLGYICRECWKFINQ